MLASLGVTDEDGSEAGIDKLGQLQEEHRQAILAWEHRLHEAAKEIQK